MFLEHPRRHPHIDARQMPIRPEFGPTLGGESMDIHPTPFAGGVVSDEPGETVEDGDGGVAAVDAVADCCAGGGVHAPCWGTDVHDCNAETFFFREGDGVG
jgi:hypothetical protein